MKQTVLNLTFFLCISAGLVFLSCANSAKKTTYRPPPTTHQGADDIPDTTEIFEGEAETHDSVKSDILQPPIQGVDDIPDTTRIFEGEAETHDSVKPDILQPPIDGTNGFLYTIGIAESLDLNIASSMATQRARANMAQKAQSIVETLSEDFQQQIRTNSRARIDTVFRQVSRSFSAAMLVGATVLKTDVTQQDGLYRIQLILGLPIRVNIDDNIEDALVEDINQEDAVYQEFLAWKGANGLAQKISDLAKSERQ